MIKDVLQAADANIYYTIAGLVIFVVAFAAVTLWTWKLDKSVVEEMRTIPFSASELGENSELVKSDDNNEASSEATTRESLEDRS